MNSLTCLPWNLLTLLSWLISTDLVRDCHTLLPGYRHTLLLRNIITHGVHHLLLLGLGHILASLIWVSLAGTSYGSPDLVMAMTFPLVLTVLLVLCHTLSLCVWLVLCLVLLHTYILVHGVALLLIDCVALLSGGWLAQSLCLSPAHLLILCGAHLCLCLLVLCVPQGGVLCPALYRTCQGGCLHRGGGLHSSILRCSY